MPAASLLVGLIISSIGAVVLGIAGALAALFAPGKLAAMAVGGLKGAAIGGAIGATAYGISKAVPIPELAEGGIINTPTLAMIGEKGPEAVVPLAEGAGAAGFDMKETNELLRALIGSNEKIGRNTADMVIS